MKLDFLKQPSLFTANRMLDEFLQRTDLCFTIKNEIAPKVRLLDFECMYAEGGRPPVSPKVLILVLIMQYLERLSDRAAAHNLRYRLDWKIALDLDLDFKGIHPTTLVYFRERLLANDKASYAFDKVLEHLREVGLVKKNSRQRIDSTHIVGNIRELSRIELFHETLRLFFTELGSFDHQLASPIQDKSEYYCEDISIRGISGQQRTRYIHEAGLTMKSIVMWAESEEIAQLNITKLSKFKILKTVYDQNFSDSNSDSSTYPSLIEISTGKDHICSPHEPEARYANKGKKSWSGYKAQIAETISEECTDKDNSINFVTYADIQDAPEHDSKIMSDYSDDQSSKLISPSEVYGDTHYNSSANIENAASRGIKLKGPVSPHPEKKTQEKNQGFKIDQQGQKIICPAGNDSKKFANWKDGKAAASFDPKDCAPCERNSVCLPEKRGKRIAIRPESELLKRRRALMETEEFKQDMHKRNGIEGTISGLVRGQGMRRSRFRGKEKTRFQIKMCGTAANVSRLHRQRQVELNIETMKAS